MNIKQKIGLGIIAPLFAIAVGHTAFQKINKDNNNRTEIVNSPNLNLNSLNQQCLSLDSQIIDMTNKDPKAAERLYSTINNSTKPVDEEAINQLISDLSEIRGY